jgi:hypothetical protein
LGVPDIEPVVRAADLDFIPFGENEYPPGSIAKRWAPVAKLRGLDVVGEGLPITESANSLNTFLGPKPNVEAFQRLTLADYLYITHRGEICTREENVISLKSGVIFSSIEVKNSHVRKLSPTSAVIVARVLIIAAAGGHDLSTETLTSTVRVKQDGKWLARLHTSVKVAQG